MGHGNCLGLFGQRIRPLLIDCGSSDQLYCVNLVNHVKSRLDKFETKDLVITHYHSDHYSFLESFAFGYFHKIFVPALPRSSSAAQVALDFLSLSIIAQHNGYPLIRLVISRGQHICPKVKGDTFKAFNKDWDVLWPDYGIIDKSNKVIIGRIRAKIDKVKEDMNRDQRQEFDKWYNRLSKAFSEGKEETNDVQDEIMRNETIDDRVQKSLEEIENTFRTLANRSSLVIKDASSNFLFTGDVDNTILNHDLNFGSGNYHVIEAPHHGGCYGKAFKNTSTALLVISRRNTDKPRCEYFQKLHLTILIDTARIGNCIIKY